MNALKTIGALVMVTTLLTSPIALGCVSAEQTGCSMSDCPLGPAMASTDCHQTESSPAPELTRDRFGDCCSVAPQVPSSVSLESIASVSRLERAVFSVGLFTLDQGSSGDPPDAASPVVLTQQHELGRFKLLASYLL